MVGMFSKQATDKLGEIVNDLFRKKSEGDDIRKDKLGEIILVTDRMIPLNKISAHILPDNKQMNEIKIIELYEMLNETVTRIPVLDNENRLKYIIHQSILFKFIFEESLTASQTEKTFDVTDLTFDDLLKHEEIKELITNAVAFIQKDFSIMDAKAAMESVKNFQDVFVTENASRDDKILGWLTNVDITKCLEG